MGAFNAIDLSSLAPPQIIEELSAEKIVEEYTKYFQELIDADPVGEYLEVAKLLPSDPAMKIIEACAYRELLLRQRINDAAKAVMVAYAQGSDLDNLAALVPLERRTTLVGDELVTEADDDFRKRVVLAPEGFSTAGPEGAYIFHALSVEGVKDAFPTSPQPTEVDLYILSNEPFDPENPGEKYDPTDPDALTGDDLCSRPSDQGLPSKALAKKVKDKFSHDIRPFTDKLNILPATVNKYQVNAILHVKSGPSAESVRKEAEEQVRRYADKNYTLGACIARSAIIAALHVEGVNRVELEESFKDMMNEGHEAGYCSKITLTPSVEEA